MKYINEVVIDKPSEIVVEMFQDPSHLSKWQPGFISLEHISGNPGTSGAVSMLKYKMGKRNIDMIETIIENDLPRVFSATYEAKGVWNEVRNYFETLPGGKTRYWTENHFKMKGIMKVFAWIMPGAFKKQSQQFLDYFKTFVEKES